jgi:hypothetical protein
MAELLIAGIVVLLILVLGWVWAQRKATVSGKRMRAHAAELYARDVAADRTPSA